MSCLAFLGDSVAGSAFLLMEIEEIGLAVLELAPEVDDEDPNTNQIMFQFHIACSRS